MNTIKRTDGWWIADVPPYHVDGELFDDCGPYGNKAEDEDDRRGLERFYREALSWRSA